MKNILKIAKPLLALLFAPLWLSAQNISIQGKVSDKSGEALVGASVSVKGTTIGASTDAAGAYSVTAPNENAVLVFSYLGYVSQEITVGAQRMIDVTLTEDFQALDEVVVVGYGTMKRSDLTGSITSVSSEAIAKSVPTSIDQVLQGHAAGVQVMQNSGMPGASTSVRIRGVSSLSASNEPIYVIDGVIIDGGGMNGASSTNTNALASINPADIVSMDILKDASATAIYGSRASNGVIIITTKRGQKGDATISYNGYTGWQEMPKKLDMLNLREYAANRQTLADLGLLTLSNSFARPDLLGDGTDWQEELFNRAMMQNHHLSVAGGNEKSTYSLSAGYLNQDGIAEGSGFQRLNLTGSFDAQVKSFLKTGASFAFSNSYQDVTVSNQSLINVALRMSPDVPVKNADGSWGGQDNAETWIPINPIALALLNTNENEMYGIRANTYADATIIEGLTFRTELSFDYNTTNNQQFYPTYHISNTQTNETNRGSFSKQYNKYWSWRNVVTYNKTLGEIHSLNAMLGQEMQRSSWDYLSGSRSSYPINGATALNLGDATTAGNSGYNGASAILSYFGRVFYSLDDKYLLTATLRRDGSSKFAPDNRWGWFPSAALAWRISNESFLKSHDVISNLKLRLGWGKVGNQNIPDNYAWMATYGVSGSSGIIATNTPNPALEWESTTSENIGVDVGLLKNRIELIADLYYKKTDNLLLKASLPAASGTSGMGSSAPPWVNLGSLENKGLELTLNTVNVTNRDFQWRSNLVFSLNRNKVLSINTETGTDPRSISDNAYGGGTTTVTQTVVGQPIGQFYGYQVVGRFEKATDFYYKDADGNIRRTPVMSDLPIDEGAGVWIGDYIYKDAHRDGKIDENDLDFIGNPEPAFTYGVGNTFTYKGIDLTVFLSGSYGNDVVNYTRRYLDNPYRNTSNLYKRAMDYAHTELIDPNGPNDYRNVRIAGGDPHAYRMPQSTATSDYNTAFSNRYVEDGSYLRIQNISLGYSFPRSWVSKIGVQGLKVYANLQNVYTFTKYSGYDPEIGVIYSNNNQLSGIDDGRYPSPRIYTFGLNLTF
ncbi:MAG: TonB-dependent receptor [Prevotellaceae bacterium]|jgi:TonB-linked SusC/RagA family outer membrane protein|nr:TonB-dependent receptor [Prevotellaceae bacterium]